MIFDTLCDITERWLPELVPLLQHATLIRFDVIAHNVLDKQVPLDDIITLRGDFTMPSRIVAVEDKGSCVVLIDPEDGLKGIFKKRVFIDCFPVGMINPEAYSETDDLSVMLAFSKMTPPGACIVTVGHLEAMIGTGKQWKTKSAITKVFVGSADVAMVGPLEGDDIPLDVIQETTRSSTKNAFTAIEELVEIQKDRWRIKREFGRDFSYTPIARSGNREVLVPERVS